MNIFSSEITRQFDNISVTMIKKWSASNHSSEIIKITIYDDNDDLEINLILNAGYNEMAIRNFIDDYEDISFFYKIEKMYQSFLNENKKVLDYYNKSFYPQEKI